MPRKIMDISLVEENKSDYTFFKIDEDENEDNKTLKALKQTYVTSNYKNETILNLQKELKTNSSEISKEIKLDSYNKYNNALDLATRHYITKAVEFIEEAFKLNPKDPDILNLKGLLFDPIVKNNPIALQILGICSTQVNAMAIMSCLENM